MAPSRTLRSLLAIALILGAGLPLWLFVIARPPEAPAAPPRDPGPVPVAVTPLVAGEVSLRVTAYGTLRPLRELPLVLEVGGRLLEVHPEWRPGAEVSAGESLLALDPRPFELEEEILLAALAEAGTAREAAASERARAAAILEKAGERVELALRELQRAEELEGEGNLARSALDRARTSVVEAELTEREASGALSAATIAQAAAEPAHQRAAAALEQARDRTARSRLAAPFAGRFEGRAPEIGTVVVPGQVLGALLDVSSLWLELAVMEDELAGLRPGLVARVTLPSRPELELTGRVLAVGVRADPTTRSTGVHVEIENSVDPPLAAGQFASAVIDVATLRDTVVLPRGSFTWLEGRPTAYVLAGEPGRRTAASRELTLGRAVGEGFVVRAGLEPGDVLLTHPLDRLRHGARVAPVGGEAAVTGGGHVDEHDPGPAAEHVPTSAGPGEAEG